MIHNFDTKITFLYCCYLSFSSFYYMEIKNFLDSDKIATQSIHVYSSITTTFTCLKSTMETPEQCIKSVQRHQQLTFIEE